MRTYRVDMSQLGPVHEPSCQERVMETLGLAIAERRFGPWDAAELLAAAGQLEREETLDLITDLVAAGRWKHETM